jgi:hypothetical protein
MTHLKCSVPALKLLPLTIDKERTAQKEVPGPSGISAPAIDTMQHDVVDYVLYTMRARSR